MKIRHCPATVMGTWTANATVIHMMGRRGCSSPKSGYLAAKINHPSRERKNMKKIFVALAFIFTIFIAKPHAINANEDKGGDCFRTN